MGGCGDRGEEGRRLRQGGSCPGQALRPIGTLTCMPSEVDTQPPPAQPRVVSLGEPETPTFPSEGQQLGHSQPHSPHLWASPPTCP